jgi:hypothetical protein
VHARSESLNYDEPIPGLNGYMVGDFWKWAYSDILSNRNRSIFAEYIVGVALGAVDKPRVEWDAVDLRYGGLKIEVKSSADCQSWYQRKPSTIQFSVRKSIAWNPESGKNESKPTRSADLYVFCHYPERDKTKANVLDVPAWDFYVMSLDALNKDFSKAKSLSLASLKRTTFRCKFAELRATLDRVLINAHQNAAVSADTE